MSKIQVLFDEHDTILRMLDVVRTLTLEMLRGAAPDVADLKAIVAFIKEYADGTHHGKEEDYLFRAMTEALGPLAENLITHGMLVEHTIGRSHVYDLNEAILAYEATGSDRAKLDIIIAAGSYETLLRRHITRENTAVFTFAERQLDPERMAAVIAQMDAFDADPEQQRRKDQHLETVQRLEAKYPPSAT